MRKIYLYLLITISTIIFLIFFQWESFEKNYIELFKQDALIEHHNYKGELDGEVVAYQNGKVYKKGTFVNGLKEGWFITYFKNGQVENKIFYRHNKKDGTEDEFYENGNLNYTVKWKNDKEYGSEFHYLEDKKLDNYDAFDLVNLFYYVRYDKSQKVYQTLCSFLSPNLFSFDKTGDSTIVLHDQIVYENINDLCVTVATPENLSPQIEIKINGYVYQNLKIIDNTIKVDNAFVNRGAYNVAVKGKLVNQINKTIKTDSLSLTITKK